MEDYADLAVMAIENSIAGSIIPNYALIDQNDLKIIGEYGLSIHHNFMALPDQKIEDIKEEKVNEDDIVSLFDGKDML